MLNLWPVSLPKQRNFKVTRKIYRSINNTVMASFMQGTLRPEFLLFKINLVLTCFDKRRFCWMFLVPQTFDFHFIYRTIQFPDKMNSFLVKLRLIFASLSHELFQNTRSTSQKINSKFCFKIIIDVPRILRLFSESDNNSVWSTVSEDSN